MDGGHLDAVADGGDHVEYTLASQASPASVFVGCGSGSSAPSPAGGGDGAAAAAARDHAAAAAVTEAADDIL